MIGESYWGPLRRSQRESFGTDRLEAEKTMDSTDIIRLYDQDRASSEHGSTEQRYREQWRWDRVAPGTHCVDCYPGNCPMHVYVRDGRVVREEQAGTLAAVERGIPPCSRRRATLLR